MNDLALQVLLALSAPRLAHALAMPPMVVDLRSDTVTTPTASMRSAMAVRACTSPDASTR